MTWLKWLLEITKDPSSIEWQISPGQWVSHAGDDPLNRFPHLDDIQDLKEMRSDYLDSLDVMARMGVLEKGKDNIPVMDSGFNDAVCKLVLELERK